MAPAFAVGTITNFKIKNEVSSLRSEAQSKDLHFSLLLSQNISETHKMLPRDVDTPVSPSRSFGV
jgi:hypothetical protein